MKQVGFENILSSLSKKGIEYLVLLLLFLWFVFSVSPLPFVQFSDGYHVWVPRLSYAASEILNWRIPFWNEFQFCGTALLADGNTNILNPAIIFYFFMNPFWAYTLSIILLFLILITGTWLYFRERCFSRTASMIGTIGYVFGGQIIFWSLYHGMNLSLALFPLTLFAFRRFERIKAEKGRTDKICFSEIKWKILAFISIFISALGGFIQFAFFAAISVVIEGIDDFSFGSIRKSLRNRLLTVMLAATSAAVIIIPTIEAGIFSHRKLVTYFSGLIPEKLPLWLMTFWGSSFGKHHYPNYFYYIGIVLIALSLFAVRRHFTKIFSRPFFIYSLIFPIILITIYLKILPTGFQFGVQSDPWRGMFVFMLALSTVAAIGSESWIKELATKNKLLFPPYELLIAGLLTFVIGLFVANTAKARGACDIGIFALGALIIIGFILPIILKKETKHRTSIFSIWLVSLMIANSFLPAKLYLSTNVRAKRKIHKVPLEYPNEDRTLFMLRRYGTEDWAIYNRTRVIGGYGSFFPKSIFIRMKNDGILPSNLNAATHYQNYSNTDPAILAKYGVLYLLKERSFNISIEGWQLLETRPNILLYKNPKYVGRAYIINEAGDIIKGANIVKNTGSYVKILVDARRGDILILADSWFPGWRCYSNGKKVEGFDADGFRGYKIKDSGHQEIEWIYKPLSFYIGAVISVISLILFLFLAFRQAGLKKK